MSIGAHSDISATSTEAQPLTSSYRVPARALSPLTHRPATGNHHHQHAGGGNAAHIHRAHDKVVLDLQRLLFEQLPPTILPTSSSTPVKGEGMTCVSAHPELAKLVTIANQQIQALPAALAHVVREDSQRSREVMLSLCTFLDAFVQQAGGGGDGDAHVSSSPATSSPANASDRPRGVEMHRPHRSNRTSTARNADGVMSSLFPTPTVVQAVPSVDGSRLDVARVTHDGSRRILLQQVPLSVELAAIALEEKRSALHAILGTQQPLQNTGSNFVDQSTPASGSPAKALLAKRANGNAVLRAVSPPGAAVNRSHSSTDNEGEPISSVQYAPTISDAMQAVKTFSRLKVAANDVAIAQEHAALVQLYLDAVNTQSATGGDSTTTPSNAKRMTDALDAAHEDLNRQLHDVDLQLRELRNIPSNTAVSKAHRVSRQVTVDKEELLGRDRLMIRSGLDMVALCIKERSSHAQLVKEERRTFQASAQSLRSSTVGRDDEVTSKNAQLKQLAAYYRECTGENEELRRMVQVLLKHHEDLERRIEASKRLPPHPSHQRSFLWGAGEGSGAVTRQGSLLSGQQLLHSYNTLLNESVDLHAGAPGHRPTTGGCGGSQRASPDNGQNNTTQHLHDSTVFTMTQRSATTNNNNNSRGGSPSSRPMSPSSEIFHVAPNLSQPRRLSTPQQSDLSSRLHDAPVRIRRSYDEVVKSKQYAKQRAMPPPSLCTKSHGSLSPDLKKRKGSRSGEDNQHGDEDVENDGDNNNDDDDDDAAATAPSIEELNTRFYQDRKDSRRKLMDRLLLAMDAKERESEAQRPLRLKGRPGFTAEDLGANVEHLYRGSMAQQIATRAKLFEELVLEKERPYSPKKLGREELDEAIKRLSTTK